jgi:phosphate-selective porin OprO/OprP
MVPIGLEWLQSDSTLALVERSLATDLVPYRDLGLMLWGEVAGGTLCYQLAILNGAPDSANGPDVEAESDKDYVGRIFVRPLRPTRIGELANLGFGAAGSYGNVRGTAAGSGLPTYHSTGQQAIFAYLNDPMGPVVAAGARWRVTPQMYFYIGPVGLLVEYVVSSQRVQRLETAADIQNRAWNLTASFVLTLEHAAYEGVIPQHPVDLRHKNFGAFELTGRYSELRLDPGAFPMYADPAVSVRSAHELAGSLNWYLTDYVRIMLSYEHTEFTGGAPNSNRLPEDAVLGRFQIAL